MITVAQCRDWPGMTVTVTVTVIIIESDWPRHWPGPAHSHSVQS